MFTGIVTHVGIVERIEKKGDWRLAIRAPGIARALAIGASVAISGVCLTVIARSKHGFEVQVSRETLSRTTLGKWKKGTRVNLERALKAGDELGGHLVSGHVDAVATLKKVKASGQSRMMRFSVSRKLARFIAPKGSVTLDGVSLTVNKVKASEFSVNIIPHTLKATTLGGLEKGAAVNLEIDLVARYLERLSSRR